MTVAHPTVWLRPFALGDGDDVVRWFATPDEVRVFAGLQATWPLKPEDLDDRARESGVTSFTASTVDAEVAGHVDIVDEGAGSFRLARIALAPTVRGRGLAAQLVLLAIDEARALDATRITLLVVPGNEPALRAYARVGFTVGPPSPEYSGYVRLQLDLD